MTNTDSNNIVIDGAVAAAALTLPWWAQLLGEWVALAVTLLTFLLIIFRLILAYRELKRG